MLFAAGSNSYPSFFAHKIYKCKKGISLKARRCLFPVSYSESTKSIFDYSNCKWSARCIEQS